VRLRGELSKVTHHGNGHVYLTIKDDKAAIDGVVWKGSVRGLGVRPEQGLEVIVTGKITTYPGRLALPDRHRDHGGGRGRRAAGPVGAAEGQAARRGPVRGLAQARPAGHALGGRGDHQPDRRGDPRHPAPHPRPLALPGAGLAGGGARRQAAVQVRGAIAASTPSHGAAPCPAPTS
jgi:hypothetical protein